MAQGFPQAPAMPMAPAGYAPVAMSPGISQHTKGYDDGRVYEAPRLKTNEEWLEDAHAAAEAASKSLLHRATIDRLNTLHQEIMGTFVQGGCVDADLINEYATLAA